MNNLFYALIGSAAIISCSQPKQEQQAAHVAETKAPAELADAKYVAIGKAGIAALASGDVENWVKPFADEAKYYFSGGDSLIGKKAIADYWTERRGKVIDKMVFSKDIWLAMKVNDPQQFGATIPGVWLMCWYQVDASYKNGGTVKLRVHTDLHFDANDKVDHAIQYFDRAPILAAMAKKK